MKSGDRARRSVLRRHRIHPPVPLDRIPTVHPARKTKKPAPSQRLLWSFFKRIWSRLPVQFTSAPHGMSNRQRDGFHPSVNPATGLPMMGGVDVVGNPYGGRSHRSPDGEASRHELYVSHHNTLPDMPPFHSDWHESRITLDSIEHRWDRGQDL